jgi:DNA (cytosine-5)-methyltransferase 1
MANRLLSLFSGCGGLDLGFEQAGFEISLAIDKSRAACATYAKHRTTKVVRGDLTRMSGENVAGHWGLASPDSAPVGVIGGPPCQFFSAGNVHRDAKDMRRRLSVRYARILADLNARFQLKFFVFENVRGLTQQAHATDYRRILRLFEAAGFDIFPGCLDAQFYGVPQVRPRVFIVGLNKSLRIRNFRFPDPLAGPIPTVQRTLSLITKEPLYFAKQLKPDVIGANFHPNHWTMRPVSPRFSSGELIPGTSRGRSFRVLEPGKPSPTIAYGHRELHVHPNGRRRVSILEAMLLQGFPPNYHLLGNLSEQVDQVSNAVSPPVAKALALAISKHLRAKRSARPRNPITR